MALYRLRLDWLINSGVLDDRNTWTFGVEAASVPAASGLSAMFNLAWNFGSTSAQRLRSITSTRMTGLHWEVYAAAGGPVLDFAVATDLAGQQSSIGAPQIAIPVTPQIQTSRTPTNRSRWMIGPLSSAESGGRPSNNSMTACLNFAAEWHRQLVAAGMTPTVLHDQGTRGSPIVGYSVGNSYGSLRSRRWDVTQRNTVVP